MKAIFTILLISFAFFTQVNAQERSNHGNKFEQLDQTFATPNTYRNADGAPGPDYWQQQVDYKIKCSLDVEAQRLDGSEVVTYHNNSPSTHRYLWLQLDENEHAADAQKHRQDPSSISETMSRDQLRRLEAWRELEKYGVNILKVTDTEGKALNYMINGTVMRLDLRWPNSGKN